MRPFLSLALLWPAEPAGQVPHGKSDLRTTEFVAWDVRGTRLPRPNPVAWSQISRLATLIPEPSPAVESPLEREFREGQVDSGLVYPRSREPFLG